ncbi:MAG: DUF5112 domain-containing protein [Bacteroidaceae bacterium]|nr:DUF5112 domain-containing protein [Bacteroidaceae bacterium]
MNLRQLSLVNRCLLLLAAASMAACTGQPTSQDVGRLRLDTLSDAAYRYHYRNLDSVASIAQRELQEAAAGNRHTAEAEALNHLAFERFQRMDFDSALVLSQQVSQVTDDAVERLVADVMLMRLSQRTSDNVAFFRHRGHALQRIARLERRQDLSPHSRQRLEYARGDLHIVASTYFYYLDQQQRAIDEIDAAESFCRLEADTAQWLYFCYMHGSGGLSRQRDAAAVASEEFDYLLKCFWVARRDGYRFFEANAAQSLAMLFADSVRLETVRQRQPEVVAVLEQYFEPDSVAWHMAEAALHIFTAYHDLYQEANALRTLGELAFDGGDFARAILYYQRALDCVNRQQESNERTVPVWIANICEQLSVAYSALDMKAESDLYRNRYLDLLDETREDAELESRVEQLHVRSARQRLMLTIIVVVAILTALLIYFLVRAWRRRSKSEARLQHHRYLQLQETAAQQRQQQDEEQEQILELQAATQQRLLRNKRQNVEKRAKLQLVQAIVPFLDRIINEVRRMTRTAQTSRESLTYIVELTTRINELNDLLTQWIQMEQGQLSLQIASFPLQPLFESIAKSHFAYEQKGLTLRVEPTVLSVKADRALTLFMLNTLADNARKFTPAGGGVTISATASESAEGRYVELAVEDTGVGLSPEDIDTLLHQKVYDAAKIGQEVESRQKGFGFGLMNCKGIIEKYRKTNPLFHVCKMGIDSAVGQGSRFWFRLPQVLAILAVWMMPLSLTLMPLSLFAETKASSAGTLPRQQAQVYVLADSVYFCNLHGRYADAIAFADSALNAISRNHVTHRRPTHDRLSLMDTGQEPLEWVWWQRQEQADYSLLLGLRNEIAVAALALHNWPLYRYNNRIYTHLYKLTNQDPTLEAFCQQTERAQQRDRMGLFAMVALLLICLTALYILWLRPRFQMRQSMRELSQQRLQLLQQTNEEEREHRQTVIEQAEDEHRRRLYEEERLHVQNQIIDNCLSTIKHETMYYPGRIQQLAQRILKETEEPAASPQLATLSETTSYYKEIYTLLSEQAMGQSEALNFRRRSILAEELLKPLPQRAQLLSRKHGITIELDIENRLGERQLRGDTDLLQMLLETLLEAELTLTIGQGSAGLSELPLHILVTADGSFARFAIENPAVALTPEQQQELFMPHAGSIPFLVAKQIIREHDTFLGHPGCRITAEAYEQGHILWFTLPTIHQTT